MRQRKIRGHNRRNRQIDNWRLDSLSYNLTDYLLNERDCFYAKIRVHPWSGLTLTNSATPEPTKKAKQKILNGLIDIYENWKIQLDKLGQPYYLKIWLFEPRFSQSQVVCAIGDRISFYENNFFKPDQDKLLKLENYGPLKPILHRFEWDYRLDEDYFDNTTIGEPDEYASKNDYEETKKWFERILKKPHRLDKFNEPIGDIVESYLFPRGDLWIGEEK